MLNLQSEEQQGQQQLNLRHASSSKVEDSTLNPEPTLLVTLKQQLFSRLQTINTQMQNIKWKTENELTPTLIQLNQQMLIYQTNPELLQLPQHHLQYISIQQNQITISSQMNQLEMTYKQLKLEANLKYKQYISQVSQLNDTHNNLNANNGTIQLNPLQSTHTNTVNLTQDVTDIIVTSGGWQADNTNNEYRNEKSSFLGASLFSDPNYKFIGSLEDAKKKGSRENKWLLINIQDTEINRDIWKDKELGPVIKESFIFYQRMKRTDNAKRVINVYRPNKFPCIFIIDPNTGTQQHRFNIPDSPDKINTLKPKMLEFLHNYPNPKAKPKEQQTNKIINNNNNNINNIINQMEEQPQEQQDNFNNNVESHQFSKFIRSQHLNSTNLHHLVYGYIHASHLTIPDDIIEIVRMYSKILPEYSIKCIAATHLLTLTIHEHLTDKRNTCEFSDELTNDVLKYIYVRGGALRDCCLSRKIKDIDIVVDVNTLSKKYLHHLKTYHSNLFHTKCIFYRHYQNQFKYTEYMDISSELSHSIYKFRTIGASTDFDPYNVDAFISEPDAKKIYNYATRISNCDWVMNTRFFLDILLKSNLQHNIHFECRQTNWLLVLQQFYYHNIYLNNISFDFVDSSGHAYGQYQTLNQFQSSFGQFETNSLVAEINSYYNYHSLAFVNSNICIPIHPTKMNTIFYDFTINTLHISFDDILSNKHVIDFNWEQKVRQRAHDQKIINDANACGLKDIHSKILKAPCVDVINICTGKYFFWRLVKIAQKFITEIEKGVWKIDEKLLQRNIDHYELWFDEWTIFTKGDKFINKFANWNINCQQDIIDRLHVFRYIGFEDHFKKLIIAQPDLVTKIQVICVPTIDTETKIISAPFFELINKCTAIYYFLKFVETIQKYMTQIQNKTWKIEEKYLNCIIDAYPLWVGKMTCNTAYWFVDKLNMITEQDLIDKIRVFRYIQFAKRFRKLIKSRPKLIEKIPIICCPSVDTNAKIIKAPHFKVIRMLNAKWYFFGFVETVQKYINEIQNNTWKIDETYLQCIINSYPLWLINCCVNKLLCNDRKWNEKYFIDRLKVFQHIKFEKHLQKVLIEYPKFFEMNNMRKCLYNFGYKIPLWIGRNPIKTHPISNVMEPYMNEYIPIQIVPKNIPYNWKSKNKPIYKNSKMYKHCKFIYDDFILKNNYYFNENNLKLSEKIKKKWSNQKRMNTLKYKRRNDRKQNAKSITKFKRRYALSLQY